MRVLLSVKPEYANRIFDGTKKYEFRKRIFAKDVRTVIVYASAPVKMIIGEFIFSGILVDQPQKLWEETQKYAGIAREDFDEYFKGSLIGYALQIESTFLYNKPIPLQALQVKKAPQSFFYI